MEPMTKEMAIETCLKVIFAMVPIIKPNAIVNDKYQALCNVISNVIAQDNQSWINVNGKILSQTKCHILSCWFHAKKEWVGNLLQKVSIV